jgi:UDP-2,3-diacylglucosamine pyrophosphatase LpxH
MAKNKIVFISDVHIGTNGKTSWYDKSVHEPYLLATLQYVYDNADSIQQLVLLGDLVDFWTYPVDEMPPTFDDIISSNPNIFLDYQDNNSYRGSSAGLLSQVLSALQGKVTYINGNHDMTLTQDDLNKIPNPDGYRISRISDPVYYPLDDSHDIYCTHGHIFSLLCAPDIEPSNNYTPLPLGYLVTRAAASYYKRILKPNQRVVDLPDSTGIPSGWDFDSDVINQVINYLKKGDPNVVGIIVNALSGGTGVSLTQPITMPDGTTTTLQQSISLYQNLFYIWLQNYGVEKTVYALLYVDDRDDLSTFAVNIEQTTGAKVVVMGHTHVPYRDYPSKFAKHVYANSGFNCPSVPDIGKKHPSFVEIEINGDSYNTNVYQILKQNGSYTPVRWKGYQR